jgi:Asp/Glu/hydantoin racemase
MASHLNDPNYWRDRAEELRAVAEHLKDPNAKAMVLGCAGDYDILAQRAEERLKAGGNSN